MPSRQNVGFATLLAKEQAKLLPISPRFQALPAVKQPPSFEQQRAAVQTVTQHLYPAMHGASTAHGEPTVPAGPSSPWNRFNSAGTHTNTAGSGQSIRHPFHTPITNGARTTNNWKFAPSGNPYVRAAVAHSVRSKAHRTAKHAPENPHRQKI